MADYTQDWADALDAVKEAGTAVTFTRTAQAEDPLTGVLTPTVTTISGSAIRVKGNPETLRTLSLVDSESPTLLFVPATFGGRPKPGDTVSWESLARTVRDFNPISPGGDCIAGRAVIAR